MSLPPPPPPNPGGQPGNFSLRYASSPPEKPPRRPPISNPKRRTPRNGAPPPPPPPRGGAGIVNGFNVATPPPLQHHSPPLSTMEDGTLRSGESSRGRRILQPRQTTTYQGVPKQAWAEPTTFTTVERNKEVFDKQMPSKNTFQATTTPRAEWKTEAEISVSPSLIPPPPPPVNTLPSRHHTDSPLQDKRQRPPFPGKIPATGVSPPTQPTARPVPPPPLPVSSIPTRSFETSQLTNGLPSNDNRQTPPLPGGSPETSGRPLTPSTAPLIPPPPPPVSSIPTKRFETAQSLKTSNDIPLKDTRQRPLPPGACLATTEIPLNPTTKQSTPPPPPPMSSIPTKKYGT